MFLDLGLAVALAGMLSAHGVLVHLRSEIGYWRMSCSPFAKVEPSGSVPHPQLAPPHQATSFQRRRLNIQCSAHPLYKSVLLHATSPEPMSQRRTYITSWRPRDSHRQIHRHRDVCASSLRDYLMCSITFDVVFAS
jgi:hypothetical protein